MRSISVEDFRAYIMETQGRPPSEEAELILERTIAMVENGELTLKEAVDSLIYIGENFHKFKRLESVGLLQPPELELIDPHIKPLADR